MTLFRKIGCAKGPKRLFLTELFYLKARIAWGKGKQPASRGRQAAGESVLCGACLRIALGERGVGMCPWQGSGACLVVLSPRRKYQRGLGAAKVNLHEWRPPTPPWLSKICVDINSYQLTPPRRGGVPTPWEQASVLQWQGFRLAWFGRPGCTWDWHRWDCGRVCPWQGGGCLFLEGTVEPLAG